MYFSLDHLSNYFWLSSPFRIESFSHFQQFRMICNTEFLLWGPQHHIVSRISITVFVPHTHYICEFSYELLWYFSRCSDYIIIHYQMDTLPQDAMILASLSRWTFLYITSLAADQTLLLVYSTVIVFISALNHLFNCF